MDICDAYHAEKNFLGEIGVCWGTKEREACSCQGDKMKCDFYPKTDVRPITTSAAHYTLDLRSGTIRAKPIITNYDRICAMSVEEMAGACSMNVACFLCPMTFDCDGRKIGKDACKAKWLDWLKQEAKGDE